MTIVYGITTAVSLLLIGACAVVDKKRNINLLLMFVSIFLCNLGYLLTAVAPTLAFALNANRLVYLGQVYLPFFMLMVILHICGIEHPKKLPIALIIIGFVVLMITASPGILPIYYKSVSIAVKDGATRLIRSYGPLHLVYYVYLILYFAAMLAVIIHAIRRGMVKSKLHATFLLSAVLFNVVIWFAEQFLPRGFELLSVSYIMTEIFIFLLYGILREYGYEEAAPKKKSCDGTHIFNGEDIEHITEKCGKDFSLTKREIDVMRLILLNKPRKEIAEELFVSESTVKKHTSAVFRKLEVTDRIELYAKVKQYE